MKLEEIENLAYQALLASGANRDAAKAMALSVMAAERDGMPSHGLLYVPIYCEHLDCGKVLTDANPKILRQQGANVVVDAGCGFAHPAIDLGLEPATKAARELGVSILAIRNSYNCGVLAYHVERMAADGLVALGFTNAPASIAPSGGNKAVIGTNPFALAVPGGNGEPAFLLDQSASVIAKSEVMKHARENKPIPETWALDKTGQPTTNSQDALKGTMRPSGGYKGFGTGLMVEVFAAALSGACLGIHASPFSGTAGGPPRTGQCFILVEPNDLSDNQFSHNIKDLCAAITSQGEARLPGSRRLAHRHQAIKQGVQVNSELVEKVRALGQ